MEQEEIQKKSVELVGGQEGGSLACRGKTFKAKGFLAEQESKYQIEDA